MKSTAKEKAYGKAYSKEYRKENPGKVREYLRKTVEERVNRNKARKMVNAPKGTEVHHISGNAKNNSRSNLRIVGRHHGGGPKRK